MADEIMFGLPSAKRIRREDLYTSRSPTPSEPDTALEEAFKRQLARIYGDLLTNQTTDVTVAPDDDMKEDDEEGFEFRLFAAPLKPQTSEAEEPVAAPRIVLVEDEEFSGDGAFVVPDRKPAYYFTGELSEERRREFELSAVTGEDVQRWLGVKYPAWEKPWKVQPMKLSKTQAKALTAAANKLELEPLHEKTTKKKPGKKRRIILRQRKKKAEDSKMRREREKQEKEDAEKEKRTRRNREKKVKRKAKEKAKKAEGKVDGAVSVAGDSGGDSGGE